MIPNAQPGAGKRQANHMSEAAATRRPRGVGMFGIENRLQEQPDFKNKMKDIRALNSILMARAAEFDKQHPDGY